MKKILGKLLRFLFRWCFRFTLVCTVLVLVFRFVPPITNYYMMSESIRLGGIKRDWTPIEGFSSVMARSVVAAEDANFCTHNGFDFAAIKAVLLDGDTKRGGSTLSQQVAKNVFLWQKRSWLRKGLEAGFTVLIELLWTKERIVEVYLNIAEFDEGVFGAAAGAKHYFGVRPNQITAVQAARLAAILPDPKDRSASRPGPFTKKKARRVLSGANTINADGRADCFQ